MIKSFFERGDLNYQELGRKKPQVLLVEDSTVVQMAISTTLLYSGYHVKLATTVGEALNKLDRERFSLLITDYRLHGESGLQLIRKVREDMNYENLPIILLHTASSGLDPELARQEGADEIMVKPIEPRELLEHVGRFLKRETVSAGRF